MGVGPNIVADPHTQTHTVTLYPVVFVVYYEDAHLSFSHEQLVTYIYGSRDNNDYDVYQICCCHRGAYISLSLFGKAEV